MTTLFTLTRSSLLHLPPSPSVSSSTTTFIRHKATKASPTKVAPKGWGAKKSLQAVAGGKKMGAVVSNEAKAEVVKKTLYGDDLEQVNAARLLALEKVVPSIEAHTTIHRAYQLLLRRRREAHLASLSRRYASLTSALEALRLTSPDLYLSTTLKSGKLQSVVQPGGSRANATGKLQGLVPRHLRLPTQEAATERGKAWNSEWKNPVDPLEELENERAKRVAAKVKPVDPPAETAPPPPGPF